MSPNPTLPHGGLLPATLPIFPIAGVLLLPRGRLPLNVFEPRYLALVDDVLATSDRLIGMIQPLDPATTDPTPAVYPVGCAGRITEFTETDDGRYLIALGGISRFRIDGELAATSRGYRRVVPDWHDFPGDSEPAGGWTFDRERLLQGLRAYFKLHEIAADWSVITSAPDERLITSLAMICPFEPAEKQALLEANTLADRANRMTALIEMAIADRGTGEPSARH
ncbi:MAG: LON peptidase substrate-binding domain-containing protein [Azospirillaceae bacterium]|nr:LON peptidase substrate-binding domain-containing protein [Azospirillaceae bacterium]